MPVKGIFRILLSRRVLLFILLSTSAAELQGLRVCGREGRGAQEDETQPLSVALFPLLSQRAPGVWEGWDVTWPLSVYRAQGPGRDKWSQ